MTTKTLLLVGTPGGAWLARARQVLGIAAADPRAEPPSFDDGRPCIAVIEGPARALAAAIASEPGLDILAWMTRWREAAAGLLRRVQHPGARCLAIEAEALWTAPADVAVLCRRRFGEPAAPTRGTEAVPLPALDALCVTLAEGALARERELRLLAAELSAACAPIGDASVRAVPVREALVRWRQLVTGTQNARVLRQRLQRTEVELEARWLADTAPAAAPVQDIAALSSVRNENAVLEVQVRQLREEVERYFVAWQELNENRATAAGVADGSGAALHIGQVERGGVRNEDPHRECAFVLHDVRLGERPLGSMRVRLVEHHGHAGIVFLTEAGRAAPIQHLRESGREDGQPYLLLIPSDANTRSALDALGASDVRLLLALVARFAHLAEELHVGERWSQVARRLLQELQALAPRLHFDGVRVEAAGTGAAFTLDAHFDDAVCGEVVSGPLHLRWRPDGASADPAAPGELSIAAGPSRWSSWPREPDGTVLGWLTLPLGRAAGTPTGRAAWAALAPADHAAASAFVRALPDVLDGVEAGAWPPAVPQAALRAAAPRVWVETRRAMAGPAWRRAVRAFLGRDLAD